MPSDTAIPEALIVSGEARVRRLLGGEGAVVKSAFACRLDGFVNDTFTQYANASIYRPPSVCRARLVSTLSDTVREAGGYTLGFTMYTAAGHDESIEVWIGHRQVARARIPDPDNRVHLFLVPERFRFRSGEPIRLVTSRTEGPCRIEHVVLLPRRPRPSIPTLEILCPHVDVRYAEGGLRAYVTWMTSRPASGQLRWGGGSRLLRRVRAPDPLVSHEAVLEGLEPGRMYRYRVEMTDRTGELKAAHDGVFRTDLSPPEGRTKRGRIPLLLRRPSPGATTWPVSAGVPFPRGALGSCEQMRMLAKDRTEIPLQARATARWEDGSVQWALLDFQADGEKGYTVEYGSEVSRSAPDSPLEVVQSGREIAVTTGPIRVVFPKDRAVFPGVVSLRQAGGAYRRVTPGRPASAVALVADDGTEYRSGKPDAVVLEESGPECACVRIDVTHCARGKALFRSTFRVHLFRGRSEIRVLHTFENDRTAEEFTRIRSLSLRADLDVGAGAEGRIGRRRIDGPGRRVDLRQTHDNRYTLLQGRRELARGRRAEGIVGLSGADAGVTLAVRDFWQNYPKGLSLDGGGMTVQICPRLKAGDYPRGGELEDRLYYYLLDGRYRLKCGVSRTHEMWFQVRSGGSAPGDFAATVQTPPLYSISLAAFNRSRAVTQLPSREKSPFPPYEEWVDAAHRAYGESRKLHREYGMLNFGDWFGERTYNWGNLEYDTPWCFLQEYLRGGHSDFYTWAEEAVRHLVDVDTCHHSAEPKAVGIHYAHCVGHVGGYYPDGYRENATYTGSWAVSHTWVEGLFLYHLLSGDARALEGAMKTCSLLVGEKVNDYDFLNPRDCGWHLIHLSAAYQATGRRVYLNAARAIVDRAVERQRDSGCWEHMGIPGVCYCPPPRHTGSAGFTASLLMRGLSRYYEATGERRAAEAIVRGVDYLIEDMWVPEKQSFRYTSCPVSRVVAGADMRILNAVAAAYRLRPDERLREVLLAGVPSAVAHHPRAHRGVGKGICSPMRGAAQVLMGLLGIEN